VISADPAGMQSLFAVLMSARPDVNLVYRLDPAGIMLFHFPTGPGSTVGTDFSFRDYYKVALQSRQPFLSRGRISPTTNQPVASAVMPLWDKHERFLGLVATNIKLHTLSTTLTSIAAEYHTEEAFNLVIIDSSGAVIASPEPDFPLAEARLEIPLVVEPVLGGLSGNRIAPDPGGEEMLFSYVPIPSASWGVIVSRPTSAAFASPRAIHRGILFSVGVFLVVGLFFWISLSRQVLNPLERLTAFSRTIGLEEDITTHQRNALSVLAGRPDQIGHLIRSLTRMEAAIGARLAELNILLETSAAVVSSLDSQTVLDRILEQVERLLDIRMCAILALDPDQGVFRARASRGLSRSYAEQLTISPSEPLSVSMRAIRSGEPIQVSDTEKDATFAATRPRSRAEGYRSVLALPLNTKVAPPSVLLVYRPDVHTFSQREISLLSNFANHAAMAIENATLYARSDLQLREQTRRLEALIQSLQDGLVLEDLDGRVLYANRRISELAGLSPQDLVHLPVDKLFERILTRSINPTERASARSAIQAAINTKSTRPVEFALETNRLTHHYQMQVFSVTDLNGMPIGQGQIISDITRNREIDRMKSSLVSTVSHELRTPLAAIKGYASTLLAEDVEWDAQAQREFLQIISSETDRLTKMVNDLLDMSRIEAGSLEVTRVECHLVDLVQRAARVTNPTPKNPIRIELPPDLPAVYVDPQRIEAVLRNLIENAAKYAGEDVEVTITAAVQAGDVVVRVMDNGPGIPAESSKRIFEAFTRLEDGLSRPAPGAGLGLAICQGFVSAHGGRIWLESQTPGACIAFSLPLEKVE
jgi:PAS domain S-box-containing protein